MTPAGTIMKDRICLVTGGTSGVGRAVATGLAETGATVIIVSRNREKGLLAAEAVKEKTGHRLVFSRVLDIGNTDDVGDFAARFQKEFQALHVLSNNAAVLTTRRETNRRGIEMIFAVNYLGHFTLTCLLLDLLKSSAPARVITVSGDPRHLKGARIDLDDLNLERHYHPVRAMVRAALAKVAFSCELAERLAHSGVTSNTFHPGLVRSNLTAGFPCWLRIPANLIQRFFSERCDTGEYLASSPDVEGVTGCFFKNKKAVAFNPEIPLHIWSPALWEKSLSLAGLSS